MVHMPSDNSGYIDNYSVLLCIKHSEKSEKLRKNYEIYEKSAKPSEPCERVSE